jgi:hypothetical protein
MHSFLRLNQSLHFVILFALLAGILAMPAHAQTPYFGATVLMTNTSGDRPMAPTYSATDAQGNVYLTGAFTGKLQCGNLTLTSLPDQYDVFVAKINEAGQYQWVAQTGGNGNDYTHGIALDSNGNIYIAGYYSGATSCGPYPLPAPSGQGIPDVFVAKLGPAGNWLWASSGGGPGPDYPNGLAVTATGKVTVAGQFGGGMATFGTTQVQNAQTQPYSNGAYTYDIFVSNLDSDGHWLNTTAAGDVGNDMPSGVGLDAAGNAYVGGMFLSANLRLGDTNLKNVNPSNPTAFVAKLSPAGVWQWATGVRDADQGETLLQSIAVTPAGVAFVTGSFTGNGPAFGPFLLPHEGTPASQDIFVASLDGDGAWRWATPAGGTGTEVGYGIAVDEAGIATVTGWLVNTSAHFGSTTLTNPSKQFDDVFIARLNASGSWRWALSATSPTEDVGLWVSLAPNGGAWVSGHYFGELVFGTTTLVGSPSTAMAFLTQVLEPAPVLARITALTPGSGMPGQIVTITGTDFIDVEAVLFNETPAASFTVQSATQLKAVVPTGATAGPIKVRTVAGTGISPTAFQPLALASAVRTKPTGLVVWPNPVEPGTALQIQLPETMLLTNPTRVELRNVLGQVAQQGQFSGRHTSLSVRGLAPGIYQLALFPAGQAVQRHRIVVE